ncbi:MAG TPA: histone deacetylase [Nitrospirota bacterium]|nr:histone deacetylase [Nitrospirota bacterium]
MRNVGLVYDEVFLRHEPPEWHPDSSNRLVDIIVTLKASGIWSNLKHVKPRKATFGDVARVHTPGYIDKIMKFGAGELDPDTYMSEDSLDAALYAAGAVMVAVDRCRTGAIERAFCLIRPPGHHAEADRAMGFCIFNNIAVGARYAQTIGYSRVFIIDFDAHHGNGTQHIFEEDDTVFYFSTHQHPYYPDTGKDMERGRGRGEGYTYNVPIPAGSGNKDFIAVYQDILPGLIARFAPDIILVSAGYDIHVNDRHANIRVSHEGIRAIIQSILTSWASPIVFALEGGYDPASLSDSVKITIEEMLKT